MAIELGMIVFCFDCLLPINLMTYLERLLPIKSVNHIITRLCKSTWQTKKVTYSLTQCIWLYLLGGCGYKVPFHKVNRSFYHMVLQGHVKHFSCSITTATRSMLPQGLWPLNLAKWWLNRRKFNTLSPKTFWTRGHVKSCDKLKAFYLHTLIPMTTKSGRVVAYDEELLFHKAIWLFDHMG